MAVQTITSPLSIASNKIVAIGRRSGNALPTVTREFNDFLTFLDIKANEIDAIALPNPRKIQELSSINVTNTLGNTGGLLSSLLSGGLDLAGLVTGKETKKGGGRLKGKPSPKMSGNKLKLGGIRGIGVINSIFAGLDFATGLAEGESVGKAAAGAGGSLAGSLLGGAIGQTLIPVPGLGFVIGSSIGGFLGGYTADRVVDTVESKGKGNQQSSLRKELDVKIREQSRQQASMVGSKSEKSFKQSVNNFSKAVDKFGEFFGIGISGAVSSADVNETEPYNYPAPTPVPKDMQFQGDISGETFLPLPGATSIGNEEGQKYGAYRDRESGPGTHEGVDLTERTSKDSRAPVVAYRTGKIISIVTGDVYPGGGITIDHGDGYQTRYLHITPGSNLRVGDIVYGGQEIAKLFYYLDRYGKDNTHLHFEVIKNGKTVDPTGYARGAKNKITVPLSIEDAKAHYERTRQPSTQNTSVTSAKDFVLEVHSVAPNETKRSGLIASYIDPPTSASQALVAEFGSYPRNFRVDEKGELGGPRRGLNLIETDMLKGVENNAKRLFEIIKKTPGQHFHLFAGHNDVTTGEIGTPGEQEYTRKVCEMIERMAKANGVKNVTYHRSIISNELGQGKSNWERGQKLRDDSVRKSQQTSPSQIMSPPPKRRPKLFEPTSSTDRSSGIRQYTSYNKPSRAPSVAVIDRNVNNIVMVGGGNNSSAPTVIAPPSNDGGMVVSYGPTPNQLRDSVAEFILISSIG